MDVVNAHLLKTTHAKREQLLGAMIRSFDQAYWGFLKTQQLLDSAMARAAYYAAAEDIVEADPFPDIFIQRDVLLHLQKAREAATEQFSEVVEMTFFDVARMEIKKAGI